MNLKGIKRTVPLVFATLVAVMVGLVIGIG